MREDKFTITDINIPFDIDNDAQLWPEYKFTSEPTAKVQTKLESFLEQCCNVGSGMIIAYAMMELVLAPVLHIGITPGQNVWVTLVLTVVSVVRGYIWRRIFNKRMYRNWANWLHSLI